VCTNAETPPGKQKSQILQKFQKYLNIKDKGKGLPRTCHEGPEGE
jgi:hypothetical protein